MAVVHSGTGKSVRLSNSHKIFGREREVVSDACAGDILGLIGYPDFRIGDTLSEDPAVVYREIPRFPPECFSYFSNRNPSKSKAWRKGLGHFVMEGIVQPFGLRDGGTATFVVGAVGPLQFEVLQYRMLTEYGAESTLEAAPFETVCWMDPADLPKFSGDMAIMPFGGRLGYDSADRPVMLFQSEWHRDYLSQKNEGIRRLDTTPYAAGEATATVDEAEALERILLD
jgi:peptide chain release factor 3